MHISVTSSQSESQPGQLKGRLAPAEAISGWHNRGDRNGASHCTLNGSISLLQPITQPRCEEYQGRGPMLQGPPICKTDSKNACLMRWVIVSPGLLYVTHLEYPSCK